MSLGYESMLVQREEGPLGGVGIGAGAYVCEDNTIMYRWTTNKGTEKTAAMPYLKLAGGSIITIAGKGWQTRATYRRQ